MRAAADPVALSRSRSGALSNEARSRPVRQPRLRWRVKNADRAAMRAAEHSMLSATCGLWACGVGVRPIADESAEEAQALVQSQSSGGRCFDAPASGRASTDHRDRRLPRTVPPGSPDPSAWSDRCWWLPVRPRWMAGGGSFISAPRVRVENAHQIALPPARRRPNGQGEIDARPGCRIRRRPQDLQRAEPGCQRVGTAGRGDHRLRASMPSSADARRPPPEILAAMLVAKPIAADITR